MNNEEFYNDIDKKVTEGKYRDDELGIDLSAFHNLKQLNGSLKSQRRKGNFFLLLFILALLAIAYLLSYEVLGNGYLSSKLSSMSGIEQMDAKDEVQKDQPELNSELNDLRTENESLNNRVADLRKQLEELKATQSNALSPQSDQPSVSDYEYSPDREVNGVIYHVVRPGENFFQLSKKYFGHGDKADKIAADNGILTPQDLHEGMTIKIDKN